MSFLYPLGLLGLIGIPILIFIYIIKNKYTEQTVASTYLWTLSERFLKRRKRVSRLTGIISLILQLLAVTVISLAIAHPVITVPNAAQEYCFIIDGSGSMNTLSGKPDKDGEPTRFEAGKRYITEAVEDAVDGSIFTVVYVGNSTDVICDQMDDKDQVKLLLSDLQPVYNQADLTDALGMAQELFNQNTSLRTCLVTDKNYETVENLEVVNVAAAVQNYAVSDVICTQKGRDITVTGKAMSYESDSTLTVQLYMNGQEPALDTQKVTVKAGEAGVFTLKTTADVYSSLEVRIAEEDALPLDNRYVIHDVQSEDSYRTLVVSEQPFFIESALRSVLNADIDVITPDEYTGQTGYGLYVFDTVKSTAITELPSDGAVWLINVPGNIEGSGYTVQGTVGLKDAEKLTHTTSTSSSTQKLVADMKGNDIYVSYYIKCGFYRNFSTLLSYNGNPVVFAGTNEKGCREVVFALDLHRSNLPLLYDFTVLVRNLVQYSFPDMIDRTTYTVGEMAEINVLTNCNGIRVESPSGEVSYLNTDVATDSIVLTEVGVYTVQMTVADSTREFYIWSSLTEEERDPTQTDAAIRLQGEATEGGFDGKFDPLFILFIALALIFLADWMVYCYEKYQLR